MTRAARRAVAAGIGMLGLFDAWAGMAQEPGQVSIAVLYRGSPAGVPVQDELALVRALGFGAIVWPFGDAGTRRDLDRFAAIVDLRVVEPAGSTSTMHALTLAAGGDRAVTLAARAWSAIADGARLIVIDSGAATGSGIEDAAGRPAPWVGAAQRLARQVEANAALISHLAPGPRLELVTTDGPDVRVVLLDGGRAWVLIAVNQARQSRALTARVPRSVPYGPWVSLVDGTDMAMIVRPDHHEYRASLAPGEARVYVIDKTPPVTSW